MGTGLALMVMSITIFIHAMKYMEGAQSFSRAELALEAFILGIFILIYDACSISKKIRVGESTQAQQALHINSVPKGTARRSGMDSGSIKPKTVKLLLIMASVVATGLTILQTPVSQSSHLSSQATKALAYLPLSLVVLLELTTDERWARALRALTFRKVISTTATMCGILGIIGASFTVASELTGLTKEALFSLGAFSFLAGLFLSRPKRASLPMPPDFPSPIRERCFILHTYVWLPALVVVVSILIWLWVFPPSTW